MGESIFKYFRGDEYSLKGLKERSLWFSRPPYFNDPFDCSMEHLITRDSPLSDKGKEFIKQNTRKFGVCCFSEDPLSHHLWSFYANGYQGFCVEYDLKIVRSFCSERFFAKCDLMKCDYRVNPLDLNEPIDWIFHDNGSVESYGLHKILSETRDTDKLFEMLLLQKNAHIWKNEKEWRIILSGRAIKNGADRFDFDGKGYNIPLPENAIKSILLGSKMGPLDRDKIKTINQDVYSGRLEIHEIELDHNSWGLKLKHS